MNQIASARILLVEDDEDNRRVWIRIFRGTFPLIPLCAAATFDVAWQYVQGVEVNASPRWLVLTDNDFPPNTESHARMDEGIRLATDLRRLIRERACIILMSGRSLPDAPSLSVEGLSVLDQTLVKSQFHNEAVLNAFQAFLPS